VSSRLRSGGRVRGFFFGFRVRVGWPIFWHLVSMFSFFYKDQARYWRALEKKKNFISNFVFILHMWLLNLPIKFECNTLDLLERN
jgi:hypothetical protein